MANSKFKKYDLNHKVDTFVRQYDKELRKAHIVTDIGEFHSPKDLRNFIESKSVYAELRWPSVYYSHWMENERQKTEKAQKIFTWKKFDSSKPPHFPRLNLTDQEINQQVLYRIIERGGNRSGARRGVLFAQDFGLDINIPVAYALDCSDPCLYDFLKPLIPQLNLEAVCPANYFARNSDDLKDVKEVDLVKVIFELAVKGLQRKIPKTSPKCR